ncbi:MAG: BT_3928 family protein [Phocaeicola sp.]
MESKKESIAIGVWVAICRTILSLTFIFSGFVKANDLLGSQYKIQEYVALLGEGMFSSLSFVGGLLQGVIEFTLGVYLLFGIRRRITTLSLLLIMLLMTPLTLWLALDNPIADCGCFGDAFHLSNWETFAKNVFLLIAAFSLVKWSHRITSFITSRFDWMVSLYTFLYITIFALYAFRELPPIDFRPYHIGVDIAQAMEIPEGAKPTQYETHFLLAKDGVEREFTLENYPDSSWSFVDSKTVVAEQGYEPTIHDFTIITQQDGFDITHEVLQDSSYTFLLVMHQMELADDSRIDLINEVYDYSLDYGYQFYAVTASGDEEIVAWKERTGAEYPFCTMDDITLKTMIRSNPGLMLLKKGVIINKWSVDNLPDEYQLTDSLENISLGEITQRSLVAKLGLIFAWFIGPLLLIALIDLVWERIKRRGERRKIEAAHQEEPEEVSDRENSINIKKE